MIGKLKGLIDSYDEDWVIVDVGGVGYQVHCSSNSLGCLPSTGEAATLFIVTHVREDQIKLFGFSSEQERAWFRLLTTVQGVGQKVALAVLSTLNPNELASAIALQDKATITRAPGIGPKVAQRILAELKDKAPALSTLDPGVTNLQTDLGAQNAPRAIADAVSALTNLGYGQSHASSAAATVLSREGEDLPMEKLIRLSLKELSS